MKLMTASFTLATPPRFDLQRTIYSHGWCSLPPFAIDKNAEALIRLLTLTDGTLISCRIQSGSSDTLRVRANAAIPLTSHHRSEIRTQLRASLRLDDDLTPFYTYTQRYPRYRWFRTLGAGRMLRAPSVFEDAVKMICTTNCSWALTEAMSANLTSILGRSLDGLIYSFPSPADVAGQTEKFIRTHIRAGYRAPFLLELAERVASGKLDIESWRSSSLPTPELFEVIRSVKGIGEYAAGNLLKLLGRYDYLGLDSWVRAKYAELHHSGRRVSDRTIERAYAVHGEWRGLVFWLEMTQQWYKSKFPF